MKYQLTFVKNLDSKKYPLLVTLCFFSIIFYVQFFHHPYWIVGDYVLYSRLGEVILADGGKNVYIFNAPQSAGVFYALLNSLTGDSFLNAKLISLFSGTGIVFFSYYIIRNIFNARIALVGQLFVALSPRINSLSIQEVSEIIPIFLIFISLYHITKKQLKLFNITIIGTLLGLAFMFRYQSLIILLAIIVFLLIHDKKIRINLLYVVTLILFFTAAASPLFLYNYYTHGVLVDSNLTVSYFYNSEYKNPELIEEIKQEIVHKESSAIFSIDPNLFLKNYFYNLFYHNPSRLFNFEHISNLSIIPPMPFLGLIPVFGGLIYLIKIKLDKKNLIVLSGTFLGTLVFVYLFGDITIHFFALFIVPIISLVILHFNRIDDNLKPILLVPIIYFIVFSITPVTKPDHLLPSWIVFPALSSIFFIEVIPKIISKIKGISHTKTKNTTYLIPIILLLFVFALNFGHSYKSTENYLYAKTYSGNVVEEFFESFTQNELREPAGLEIKKIGDILAAQPEIKDSYVMGGIELYAYYANSNLIGASFQEGPENDTIENYITRKNWSDYELYLTNQASHPPIDIKDNNKPLPDYLIYSPSGGLLPLAENKTQHNIPKILSDPTNPQLPDNFKVIYHSNKTGMIIYKIIH
jgi:hypothetical protein